MSRRGSNSASLKASGKTTPTAQAAAEATASVDLSNLFSFNPTALELVLKTVLTRLDSLERGGGAGDKDGKTFTPVAPAPTISRDELADLKDKLNNHHNRLNDLEGGPPRKRDVGDEDEGNSIGGWGDRKAKDFENRLESLEDGVKKNSDAEESATKDDLKALKDRHDELQTQVDDLTEQNDKKAYKESVDTIGDSLGDTQKDVEKLQELMDNVNSEMDNLRVEQGKMQGRLGTIEGLTSLLNSKEDAAGGLGKELNSFTDTLGEVKGKQATAEAVIEALQGAVKTLEKSTADLDKEKEASNDAERKYKALEEELKEMKQKQRDLEDATEKLADDANQSRGAGDDFATKPQVTSLGGRIDDLERRLEGLSRRSPPPAAAPAAPVAAPAAGSNTVNVNSADVSDLNKRLNDLAGKHSVLQDSFDGFRKEARGDLANLNEAQLAGKKEISALGTECSKLSADASKRLHDIRKLEDSKANKSDLGALKEDLDKIARKAAGDLSGLQTLKDQMIDATARLQEQSRLLSDLKNSQSTLQGATSSLQNEKAGKDMVGHLSVDVSDLTKKVAELATSRPSNKHRGDAASEDAVKELQNQINGMILGASTDREWAKGQLVEIRATVEHIHHSKADSSLVANKAERDYVENAMEKLMREVEQVLNSTNSGLIDTIDKSLNILRDMIDGKATKDDVNTLKKTMVYSQDGSPTSQDVPDGLMGYKGYRCLGCNRTMDGMRQRPMGSSFSSFMNRVPSGGNTRVPKPPLSAGGAGALMSPTSHSGGPPSPAGYLTAPPGSA